MVQNYFAVDIVASKHSRFSLSPNEANSGFLCPVFCVYAMTG